MLAPALFDDALISFPATKWRSALPSQCSLCEHLALDPRPAENAIGVRTSSASVIDRAHDRFARSADGRTHILMPVCAEHAADVFRGRIAGFEMAWRLV